MDPLPDIRTQNFSSLCHHRESYGIRRTVKKSAAQACLQLPYVDQIMTVRQLHEWANENIFSTWFLLSKGRTFRRRNNAKGKISPIINSYWVTEITLVYFSVNFRVGNKV
jgi:hypothetical protein